MRTSIVGAWVAFACVAATATGAAAQTAGQARDRVGFSVGTSIGFVADPTAFLVTLEAPFAVGHGFSVGPLVQLGVSDDDTIVAPTMMGRYAFDLSGASHADVRRISPFIQTGLGFAYIEKDRRFGDDDDIGFLFNVGGGAEFFLTDQIAVGSNVLFNILPDSTVGENFFFSWQVASVRFLF